MFPDSDDCDQERDPAGHIPSFNFAFQCVLSREIGGAGGAAMFPDSDDCDQERDPAGHIPSFNFAFQCVLSREIGAAVVDRCSKPVMCLRSPGVLSNG
jgi:hypothetical protein